MSLHLHIKFHDNRTINNDFEKNAIDVRNIEKIILSTHEKIPILGDETSKHGFLDGFVFVVKWLNLTKVVKHGFRYLVTYYQ